MNQDEENTSSLEMRTMQKVLRNLQDPPQVFNEQQFKALQRVADRELGYEALRKAASAGQRIIVAIGTLVALAAAFKGGFLDWLKGALK